MAVTSYRKTESNNYCDVRREGKTSIGDDTRRESETSSQYNVRDLEGGQQRM